MRREDRDAQRKKGNTESGACGRCKPGRPGAPPAAEAERRAQEETLLQSSQKSQLCDITHVTDLCLLLFQF